MFFILIFFGFIDRRQRLVVDLCNFNDLEIDIIKKKEKKNIYVDNENINYVINRDILIIFCFQVKCDMYILRLVV